MYELARIALGAGILVGFIAAFGTLLAAFVPEAKDEVPMWFIYASRIGWAIALFWFLGFMFLR